MRMNRRAFVVKGAAAVAGVALFRGSVFGRGLQDTVVLDKGFAKVIQIAEGVWATIADPSKGPQCVSNGGVITGEGGAILFEGHMQPAGAALEIEAAKLVSKGPIRAAFNSHFHYDHTFGNSAYADQRISIVAHPDTPKMMREQYIAIKGKTGVKAAAIEKQMASATSDLERAHLEADLAAAPLLATTIEEATITLPTDAMTRERIQIGGLVVAIDAKPGHTPTDLVVSVPERAVIFTGDLVQHGMYPVAIDANMTAWRKVLDEFLKEPVSTRFVPGHGSVCGVKEVRAFADVFDDLREHAETMMKAGVPVREAQHRYVVPARFKDRYVYSWGFTIGASVAKYYEELK